MGFYEAWLASAAGELEARRIAVSPKCRLGTDSTVGAWVAALRQPVLAVDFLNFNQNWPWPLPTRCHGEDASKELVNLHAFHMFGNRATEPQFWMHLHNQTTLLHAPAAEDPMQPSRFRCRHAEDSPTAKRVLRRLVAANAAQAVVLTNRSWLTRQYRAYPRSADSNPWDDRQRLDLPDWLYCGVQCVRRCTRNETGADHSQPLEVRVQTQCGPRCQSEWPELSR